MNKTEFRDAVRNLLAQPVADLSLDENSFSSSSVCSTPKNLWGSTRATKASRGPTRNCASFSNMHLQKRTACCWPALIAGDTVA